MRPLNRGLIEIWKTGGLAVVVEVEVLVGGYEGGTSILKVTVEVDIAPQVQGLLEVRGWRHSDWDIEVWV